MEHTNEMDLIRATERTAAATQKIAEHLNDVRVAIDNVTAVIMCAPGQSPSVMPSKEGYWYWVDENDVVHCSDNK